MSNLPGYLYCFKFKSGGIAKIGMSSNPKSRMQSISSMLPFDVEFMRVIGFESHKVAAAWERHILMNANRHNGRGEWVIADEKLSALLDSVADGTDVTEHFRQFGKGGRPIPVGGDSMRQVCAARLASAVSVPVAASIKYDGAPEGYDRALVLARLSDGYGVEDIAVIDGIPVEQARAHVSDARSDGALMAMFTVLEAAE